MGDDSWPQADLVDRRGRWHRLRPEREMALLGHVDWAAASRPTAFMDWLNSGPQFDFDQIDDPDNVRGSCFYTANVSAKRSFLLANGGFDEGFPHTALEDIELGCALSGSACAWSTTSPRWSSISIRATCRLRCAG